MTIRLFTTATRTLDEFTPPPPHEVTMYHCGPTVYNYAHIGNLRAYVFADILRRTFEASGYTVRQIINITDIGHLVGDGDEGEDKMTAALKREGRPLTKEAMAEVGERYFRAFKDDLVALNILPPYAYPKASEHIAEDIALIETLTKKGFTYRTSDGIYFDTVKFGLDRYAHFASLDLAGMQGGARVGIGEKHAFTDFALWKYNDTLGYDAPFGTGFPGWHIECSAMSQKYLGQPFDIHTGGIDHIPVHHTNEIAQSEAAADVPLARYWMHSAHMTVDGQKMSKSLGNTFTLAELHERGVPPMAYRYWLLTAHYRTTVNVTWDALAGAQSAYNRLTNAMLELPESIGTPIATRLDEFMAAINDDLNTASALAVLWKTVKDTEHAPEDIHATLLQFDRVFGLSLSDVKPLAKTTIVPKEVSELVDVRAAARAKNDFAESDRLRNELKKLGYEVKDTPEGQKLTRI